jgi:hypothetical protein
VIKLTVKEIEMIRRIQQSPFIQENGGWTDPGAVTWSVDVVNTRGDAAVLGSLVKKALVRLDEYEPGQNTLAFTDLGRQTCNYLEEGK